MSEPVDPRVEQIRASVETARGIQQIPDRHLLADPETTPDTSVSTLRARLQRRRQRASLRYRHRAARRAERARDFDAAMDDRGHRELRKRQLATSPARKAANLARIQAWVIVVAIPAIIALGAASTAGVHAFMVAHAGASAAVAWAVEPAIIALVAGVILVRALMLRNGATCPPLVGWIERGALVAVTVERIIAGIAEAKVDVVEHHAGAGDDVAPAPGERWIAEQAEVTADQIAVFLARQDPPDGGVTSSAPHDAGGGPRGGARTAEREEPPDRQIESDQGMGSAPDRDGGETTERVIPAAQARRLKGLRTRYRIAEHAAAYPDHNAAQIAAALDLGESTVRRHLKLLEAEE